MEGSVGMETKSLSSYLRVTAGRLNEKDCALIEKESLQDFRKMVYENKGNNWKEKALHGEFFQQTLDTASAESCRWLRNGFLTKETEGLILAAQEQALETNSNKHSIDKTFEIPFCRLCGDPLRQYNIHV